MKDRRKRERARRAAAGFTLVEVMLVVVILGILASVGVVALRGRTKTASIAATRMTIREFCTAIDTYEVDTGGYPASLQDLVADPGQGGWQGPYFPNARLPKDAWGHDLTYAKTDTGYTLTSAGPDGQFGGGDDLTN